MKTVFDDLFPDPLFESYVIGNKVCLACGSAKAKTALRTVTAEIIPICGNCSFNWNFYGYEILKNIKPKILICNLIKFKIKHPFYGNPIIIYRGLKVMEEWSIKMKKWIKSRKEWVYKNPSPQDGFFIL